MPTAETIDRCIEMVVVIAVLTDTVIGTANGGIRLSWSAAARTPVVPTALDLHGTRVQMAAFRRYLHTNRQRVSRWNSVLPKFP